MMASLCPSIAHTAVFTYAYKGNPFTTVSSPYTTSDSVAGQFTVNLPSNANLNVANVTNQLQALSFTDGHQTFTQNTPSLNPAFFISTDAGGNITAWNIGMVIGPTEKEIFTKAESGVAIDTAALDDFKRGSVENNPGSWTQLPTGGLTSHDTVCENKKLEAAASYFQCLIGVYRRANIRGTEPSGDSIAQCDDHFRRVVEQAEAGGACHTPGNASVLGDLIKADARAAALGITAELGGCTALNISSQFATCTLGVGSRAVDLPAVLNAINNVGGNVNNNTPFYIEAWGGDGGAGNTNNGSRGGYGGYAQTTTTTSAVAATYKTTELYYFLGQNGTGGANAGGDGGTATMITTNDLATEQASIPDALLIAGGAGGGGAGRDKECACGCDSNGQGQENGYVLGALGGDGGAAIAALDVESLAAGAKGGEREGVNLSGSGGVGNAAGMGGAVNGADHILSQPATVGGNGIAPIGGVGGNHSDPQTGFANSTTVISNDGGRGGNGQEDAGGGGGGGGYGGGGGGAGNVDPNNSSDNTQCITGGGGGGASLAVESTATCSAAPTSKPANPNGSQGFARIIFDLGGCQ
jgi:hypothetical protein